MPTITFSHKDLCNLVGKEISVEEVGKLLEKGKGEFDSYDEETDEISVSFDDTNLPYLWSVEGVARLIKGLIGKEKGIPKLEINKSANKLVVDKSVKSVRPYISAFIAKGCKIDDYLLKQMIDLQEKFCEGYGRRRKKVAIGVYNFKKIDFPVHYKATNPESVKFTPLEYKKEMTQQEILEEHEKGKEYAWILEGQSKYPILIDSKDNVLSFPPIINSDFSGKLEIGDADLFFEATGEDLDSVLLATNIFAQALYERGFKIESVDVEYPDETITTPFMFDEKAKIEIKDVNNMMGLDLKENDVKELLEKMQYNYNKGEVSIPCYRKDIMHPVDVMEDIAIAYGYDNIEMLHMKSYTAGETFPIVNFVDKARDLVIGFGYQEIMSSMLTNKEILYDKMNVEDFGTIEIKEYSSERYSVVRNWLLPILMEALGKNKHVDYPQKIFEEGLVTVKDGNNIKDIHRIAGVSAHTNADYTEARQVLDGLLAAFGVEYKVIETEHPSFIPGRVGRVIVNGKKVAYVGELAPEVVKNFDINVPVAGFELNLTELFEVLK